LKLNVTHQLLVYADDVNILGGSVCSIKKNTDAFVVAIKGTGLEQGCLTFFFVPWIPLRIW